MKRKSTRRRETNTGERCREYAMQAPTRCEVWKYLVRSPEAKAKLGWYDTSVTFKFDIHHVVGQPLPKERDYFSNLLHLSDISHRWVEKYSNEGQLACLYAKYEMHVKQLILNAAHGRDMPEDVSKLHWHVPTMNRASVPYAGLEGRLHYLLAQDVGPVFRGYGEELLKVLEG